VVAAAAIGFFLGACAAYFLEYLDDTIKTPDDVQQVTSLATLAGIATFPGGNGKDSELITRSAPRSPIGEAYRGLRTSILFANVDRPTRTLLITSPNPGEGKSVTVANLGVVMAQAGHRVLIVDGDLRRPTQHKLFNLGGRNVGLTNLLLQMLMDRSANTPTKSPAELLEGAIYETQQRSLYLMTSGALPPNPAEMVGSEKMATLLQLLTLHFDFVLVDSPPALAVTDAVVLSARVDGVVLVNLAGRTRRNQLQQAVTKLQDVNANLLGVVLNRLSPKTAGYYEHYYYSRFYQPDESLAGDPGLAAEAQVNGHNGRRRLGARRPRAVARSRG
jgi:capsular exopolysaccharide synthesis family protein